MTTNLTGIYSIALFCTSGRCYYTFSISTDPVCDHFIATNTTSNTLWTPSPLVFNMSKCSNLFLSNQDLTASGALLALGQASSCASSFNSGDDLFNVVISRT
jgi:hypothetical protein